MASLALPARGAWGGSVYEEYKLVPCSSRPAGVVTRDIADLLPVSESLNRPRSCNLLLAASTPEHVRGGHAFDGRGGAGGEAETTEPDFGHHLARTNKQFEQVDSPPPDGGSSNE